MKVRRIPFPHTALPHATFPGTSTSQAFSAYPRLHLLPHSQTFHALRLFMPPPCKPCLFGSFLSSSFLIPKHSMLTSFLPQPQVFLFNARLFLPRSQMFHLPAALPPVSIKSKGSEPEWTMPHENILHL